MNTSEAIKANIQSLYHARGFQYLPVTRFEEYDLYQQNKNFLSSEHLITFTDTKGKLLALKPDITLSIAKTIPNHLLDSFHRYYYIDDVYRLSKSNLEYNVIQQIGVELMGPVDSFSNIEIIVLALDTLALLGNSYLLDISHNGFLAELLELSGLSEESKRKVQATIDRKSLHELEEILIEEDVPTKVKAGLSVVCTLAGTITHALSQLEPHILNATMEQAFEELSVLNNTTQTLGLADYIHLDFSASGDFDYYNGFVLQGYVADSPSPILTGGQYNQLMQKMGKKSGAIGFAVSLSLLEDTEKENPFDFDILIFYPPTANYAQLIELVKKQTDSGNSVRLEPLSAKEKELPFTYKQSLTFSKEGFCG